MVFESSKQANYVHDSQVENLLGVNRFSSQTLPVTVERNAEGKEVEEQNQRLWS